jgi:hypothetical protein
MQTFFFSIGMKSTKKNGLKKSEDETQPLNKPLARLLVWGHPIPTRGDGDYAQIRDHPFKKIFTIFDPYPPTIGNPAKCL